MTERIEDQATIDIIEDIAALARKLAVKEPFQSATVSKLCGRLQRISMEW